MYRIWKKEIKFVVTPLVGKKYGFVMYHLRAGKKFLHNTIDAKIALKAKSVNFYFRDNNLDPWDYVTTF